MDSSEPDQRDRHPAEPVPSRIFPMLVSPLWRPSLALLGVRTDNAYASLTDDGVAVRVGRLFHAHIPLASISLARAGSGRRVCHFGVCVREAHRLALVASRQGVVELALSEPHTASLVGRPTSFLSLAMSLEGASSFLEELYRQQQEMARLGASALGG